MGGAGNQFAFRVFHHLRVARAAMSDLGFPLAGMDADY
jgi:hypothetical protein